MSFTIGSLFDGSGGFPLAATMCGGIPVWASEIEPYPIAVTKARFPQMKHLGSVTDINGVEVDPVDVITFGSPCQDLSVAGKRAGLKHTDNGDDETTRSGLFMEAVRIIKEMREKTNGKYPRFAIWENVPGAFSSNRGEDFRIVLEEFIKIAEPAAVMPSVPAKGGWPYADSYTGDGWSLAYRVLDAQYWGVPQRRRRIYLVLDLGGLCARKILFEREGLRGHFEESGTPWQAATRDAENGVGATDCDRKCYGIVSKGNGEAWTIEEKHMALSCGGGQAGQGYPCIMEPTAFCTSFCHQNSSLCIIDTIGGQAERAWEGEVAPTLKATHYKMPPCVVYSASGFCPEQSEKTRGIGYEKEKAPTLRAGVVPACVCGFNTIPIHDQATRFSGKHGDKSDGKGNGLGVGEPGDPMNTLTSCDRHAVAYCTDIGFFNSQKNVSPTLLARQYKDPHLVTYSETDIHYIVRRFTPTECARLQGFADEWAVPDRKEDLTDEEYRFWLKVRKTHAEINGKATKDYTKEQILKWYNGMHTDSAEYKLWGNGIALPCALYVMQGIADAMKGANNND